SGHRSDGSVRENQGRLRIQKECNGRLGCPEVSRGEASLRGFTLLGDPHLGRTFVHGVPLHRRGEREAMLWRDFAQSLSNVTTHLHICLGDLFDRAAVSYHTIVSAARLYMHAAAKFPETKFIILRGNHD